MIASAARLIQFGSIGVWQSNAAAFLSFLLRRSSELLLHLHLLPKTFRHAVTRIYPASSFFNVRAEFASSLPRRQPSRGTKPPTTRSRGTYIQRGWWSKDD